MYTNAYSRLPFAALMVIMYSLWQGLLTDTQYLTQKLSTTSITGTARTGNKVLLKYQPNGNRKMLFYAKTTALLAMYQF